MTNAPLRPCARRGAVCGKVQQRPIAQAPTALQSARSSDVLLRVTDPTYANIRSCFHETGSCTAHLCPTLCGLTQVRCWGSEAQGVSEGCRRLGKAPCLPPGAQPRPACGDPWSSGDGASSLLRPHLHTDLKGPGAWKPGGAMVPAPPSIPLSPTFPDRYTRLTPASSSDGRRKQRHHQEMQRLPFVKKRHSHRGGEHSLSDQEQLPTAGILWVPGIYFTLFCQ